MNLAIQEANSFPWLISKCQVVQNFPSNIEKLVPSWSVGDVANLPSCHKARIVLQRGGAEPLHNLSRVIQLDYPDRGNSSWYQTFSSIWVTFVIEDLSTITSKSLKSSTIPLKKRLEKQPSAHSTFCSSNSFMNLKKIFRRSSKSEQPRKSCQLSVDCLSYRFEINFCFFIIMSSLESQRKKFI